MKKSKPLILILSSADDQSTIDVIRWLRYLHVHDDDIIRLNDTDKISLERMEISSDGVEMVVMGSIIFWR